MERTEPTQTHKSEGQKDVNAFNSNHPGQPIRQNHGRHPKTRIACNLLSYFDLSSKQAFRSGFAHLNFGTPDIITVIMAFGLPFIVIFLSVTVSWLPTLVEPMEIEGEAIPNPV